MCLLTINGLWTGLLDKIRSLPFWSCQRVEQRLVKFSLVVFKIKIAFLTNTNLETGGKLGTGD